MADVTLNIRGRDDGAGSTIDSLRNKINDLADAQGKLNDKNVRDTVHGNFDEKKDRLREEYKDARDASFDDYQSDKNRYDRGEISKKDFEKSQKDYEQNIKDLNSEEKIELRDLQIEENSILRQLLDEFRQQRVDTTERRQSDDEEFDSSSEEAKSDDGIRVFVTNWPEDFGKGGDGGDGGNSSSSSNSSGKGNDGQYGAGMRQAMLGMARGDLTSTIMGGAEMAGSMIGGNAGKAIGVAALVAMIVKEFIGHGEKVQEALGQSAAMRGGFNSASEANTGLQSQVGGLRSQLGYLGLTGEDFAAMTGEKAKASGMAGNGLLERTLNDFKFQKGFGADVGVFSQFERFTKNQETSTTIGLDVLNVLTSIDESSLKVNDLSTLTEKLHSQQSIMSFQRSKRDMVDNDASLRILAAFEKIGLSRKGEGAGDFLTNTIQGLGKGGGNEMLELTKYEAIKRAYPELANDPAQLERFIRFHPDDPKYMAEMGKMINERSDGSQLVKDAYNYSLFDPQSEYDLDMYGKMGSKQFTDTLAGKGVNKGRKATLDAATMESDAQSSVGMINATTTEFSNDIQAALIEIKDLLKGGLKIVNWPSWFSSPKTKKG